MNAEVVGGRRASWQLAGALCLGAYVYGSLPFVYVLGKRRHVDLKRAGSGNVGATNLMAAGGPAPATVGWLLDASKGLAPVVVARSLGCADEVAGLAGVCGVAGQCWPLFLRFQGGRGISAYVGATAALAPRVWGYALAPMIGGGLWRALPRLWHSSGIAKSSERAARGKAMPLGCFISADIYPALFAANGRRSASARWAPALLPAVLLARRLTAPQPDDATVGPRRRRVALLYRLLYDRNTSM
ncbi:MAG TPA: glycerol-3-phosphate acyltransferase [Ktedonobacterales bacterium]|nr:glycerol-3-phosphate acyltransferase [Ktedonobacterales bacterium]